MTMNMGRHSIPSDASAAPAAVAHATWLPWILRRASRSLGGDPTALQGLEHDEAGAVCRAALELLEERDRLWPRRSPGRAA
jgi:hypothetical protein